MNAVLETYKAGDSKHQWGRHNDYISEPKPDGYRSYHLVLRFSGSDVYAPYDGLLVEVQFRTRMQHAWATAVEAVGLYRNENLKAGDGDPQWLRFLQLMSSEIALSEELPLVPGTSPNDKERRQEIAEINKQLRALDTLAGFRKAVKETEGRLTDAKYYLIQYDTQEKRPIVTPYDDVMIGSNEYDAEESKNDPKNAVLVEVDKVEDLREAYPNYFLDVAAFESGLRKVLNGEPFSVPAEPPRPASSYNIASILQGWQARRKRSRI